MEKNIKEIVYPIVNWYQEQEKVLPWKQDKEPYHIWISEIMLQQTRIEAVKKYYIRFMQRLPNVHELANISEEELLKLWEGLGYYSRARNLKKAAIQIEHEYNGKMPSRYQELMKLSGIGEYTAGAIASISYNEKVPAVDGNVLRVISRVLASKDDVLLLETKKKIRKILLEILPNEAGDFNEGLMELGEKICLPNTEPLCNICPIQEFCKAYQYNLTKQIPVRIKKLKRKIENKTVFILKFNDEVAIRKRSKKGLLADLYEFPNIEGNLDENEIIPVLKDWSIKIKNLKNRKNFKHIFTHIEWKMTVYEIEVVQRNSEFLWTQKQEIGEKYALPTAFKKLYINKGESL